MIRNLFAEIIAPITRIFYPRGAQRILRLFFNPKNLSIKQIIKYDHDLKININTTSYVEWELFFRGYYEKWVIDIMKKIIPSGGVVVDAGANIGTHTLIMAKIVGDGGCVLAFDPDPKSIKRLTENTELNSLKNIKIFQSGLSDKAGTMALFPYSEEMSDQGTASFYKLPKLRESELQVSVHTLDEILGAEDMSRLDFVKIDTRGSDLPIIRGASGSIKKFRPYVVFEYNLNNWNNSDSKWEEARDFFMNLDYVLYNIDQKGTHLINKETDGKTSYNILAVPKEKQTKL